MPDLPVSDGFDFYNSEDDQNFIDHNIYQLTDLVSNNNSQIFIETYECCSDFSFVNDDAFIIVSDFFYFLDDLIEPESFLDFVFEFPKWFAPHEYLTTFVHFINTKGYTYSIVENPCTCTQD